MVMDHANGWCCVDCLMLLANGETPSELDETETAEFLARVDVRAAGTVTLGRMFGEDGCEHTSEDWVFGDSWVQADHASECEQIGFSWSACDVCGSTLGGSRDAVTFWL
jgi:hypothetical protein